MTKFAVSFRVGANDDYDRRYRSITEKIDELSTCATWQETTSFYLVEYTGSAQGLADRIYFASEMNAAYDTLLVVTIGSRDYGTRGKVDYPNTLASFFR